MIKTQTISEIYDSCSVSEKQEFAKLLSEDGLMNLKKGNLKPINLNDEIYLDSLNILRDKRHLLSPEEENYINRVANKFRYY